jgi:hypothetical protein
VGELRKQHAHIKWFVGKNDKIYANGRIVADVKATPADGVDMAAHIDRIVQAANVCVSNTNKSENNAEPNRPEKKKKSIMTDALMWKKIKHFNMPINFTKHVMSSFMVDEQTANVMVEDYKRFMYLLGIYPYAEPPHHVGLVWTLHMQYTLSYRSIVAILGMDVNSDPSSIPATDEYFRRTLNLLQKEFNSVPNEWFNRRKPAVTLDPSDFIIIRKPKFLRRK